MAQLTTVAADREPVPRVWPVLVALGAVGVLVLAMLGADLVLARGVARKTADIVGNSQRSVELVDDLRGQVHRLAAHSVGSAERQAISERIAEDARLYDPLATYAGERAEWEILRAQIAALESQHPIDPGSLSAIGVSVDRLVEINRQSAHAQADAIRAIHQQAIVADGIAGLVTLVLVTLVGAVVVRMIQRQRRLAARHIALVEERNRELDAFASRAAHDLRAPLNPIKGYADLLMAGNEPPEEIHAMASRIRIAVDRMVRIVDDMLELSRAGRPAPGEASPRRIGGEVLEELAAELHGVEVKTELTDDPVACAPGVLAQILRNLIGNAVKFRSRQRKLALRIEAAPKDGRIELRVEDNGVGMDSEAAQHAFEPYYRGRTDREVPGHGLGLAIVQRAVAALGGGCVVEAAPDRGARITVTLPRARA